MGTLQPLSSAAAAGESALELTPRSASCEAAGQQVAGSPHSTIPLDEASSPGLDQGGQSPSNDAVTQGDNIENPIEIGDSEDGQLVRSVEPYHRRKRKRGQVPTTEEIISIMVSFLSSFSLSANNL